MTNLEKLSNRNKRRIVAFHIGRGGRFYNSGFKTFLGENEISDYTTDLFFNEETKQYLNGNGEEVGLSEQDVASGVGVINIDNEYDTTYTVKIKDLDEAELCVMANEVSGREILAELFDNVDVLYAFGWLDEAINCDYFDFDIFNIEEISEDVYFSEDNSFEDNYKEINGKFYHKNVC